MYRASELEFYLKKFLSVNKYTVLARRRGDSPDSPAIGAYTAYMNPKKNEARLYVVANPLYDWRSIPGKVIIGIHEFHVDLNTNNVKKSTESKEGIPRKKRLPPPEGQLKLI